MTCSLIKVNSRLEAVRSSPEHSIMTVSIFLRCERYWWITRSRIFCEKYSKVSIKIVRKFRFVKNAFLISERNFCTCCLSISLKSRYFTFRRMFIIIIIRTRGDFLRKCDSTKKNPQNFKNFRSLEGPIYSKILNPWDKNRQVWKILNLQVDPISGIFLCSPE